MFTRWHALLDISLEIVWLYIVIVFGKRLDKGGKLFKSYKFRGKTYLV